MFSRFKQWWKKLMEEVELQTRKMAEEEKWDGPYVHEDLNVEVRTKDEHEAVARILRMKVKEINATLRDFKSDVKLTPELWSPRKYQLIGRALRKRINELNEETLRRKKAWETVDEIVEAMAWMREQRAYSNINKEARRREMRRIRRGEF
jgi:hypothetical protein